MCINDDWVEKLRIFGKLKEFLMQWAEGIFNLLISNLVAESTAENFHIFAKHDLKLKV